MSNFKKAAKVQTLKDIIKFLIFVFLFFPDSKLSYVLFGAFINLGIIYTIIVINIIRNQYEENLTRLEKKR